MSRRPLLPHVCLALAVLALAAAACSSPADGGADGDEPASVPPADDEADDARPAARGDAAAPRPRGSVAGTDEADERRQADHDAAVTALQDGGQVVFIRHGATEHVSEGPDVDLDDVSTQRNLSDEGRRQAEAIGEGFERLDIPVGAVLSSPYWRARETAEIAFGADAVDVDQDLIYDEHPDAHRPDLADALRALLARTPADGTNTVVVGHGANLQGAARVIVDDGAAAVFTPTPGGGADLVGVVPADAWEDLATRHGLD